MKKKLLKKVHCIEKGCTFAPTNDASVAQLVEHLTLNQGVQGSTPCCFFLFCNTCAKAA